MRIRLYGELNQYLPSHLRGKATNVFLPSGCTVKSLIDIFGVPFPEVDLIIVDSEPVGFEYELQDDDQVSLFPEFQSLDISPLGLINRGYVT